MGEQLTRAQVRAAADAVRFAIHMIDHKAREPVDGCTLADYRSVRRILRRLGERPVQIEGHTHG